ncbi:neuromedin Ba [Chanos chanos]|uniref:Neuromedin Ba n=1 Tax=Chanos chanos TaxID=29144 RepID=A0A6J2UND9_CHACN|nr:neuromedin-B-like [Chanos chanos]
MALRSASGICKLGLLLAYFLMMSDVPLSSSVSLDLTELRNKVSKIKVNPRGNLWATGHFMGKKSIVDSPVLESPEPKMNSIQASIDPSSDADNLRELITQEVLKVALQAQLQDVQGGDDSPNQDTDFLLKLLKSYTGNRK